jgi:hypothetical protein
VDLFSRMHAARGQPLSTDWAAECPAYPESGPWLAGSAFLGADMP